MREYAGVRAREIDADQVIIVTSSRFTEGAKDEARDLNVKLVNGDDLLEMVERLGAEDVLEKHSPTDDSEGITASFGEETDEEFGTYFAKMMGFALTAIGGVGIALPGPGDEFGIMLLVGIGALAYVFHQQGEISL